MPLDPADPNNQRTVTPDQQPIIDAYREAAFKVNLNSSVWPLDAQSVLLLSSPVTSRLLASDAEGYQARTEANQVLDISGGLTLRPYVVETSEPNRKLVYDCQIDATFWKDVDTGEKAPPDGGYPNAGPPGVEWGTGAVVVLVDGRWLVDEWLIDPTACA